MSSYKKKLYDVVQFIVCVTVMISCSQTETKTTKKVDFDESIQIVSQKDTVLIRWEQPDEPFDSVDYYKLFYHTNVDTNWKLLFPKINPSQNPGAFISWNDISSNDSIYHFGVMAVMKSGKTSSIHSNNDETAMPKGWVLKWSRK